MPPKARIAVIGTGWWATYAHIPTLKAHPDAQLVALADVRSEVLSKASERYDIGTVYRLSNATVTLDEIEGDRLEIRATFSWESAQEFGLGGTARLKSMVVWQMNAI